MSSHLNEQNFYEILEVLPDAPQDEIHRAYQRAKDTYNPDSPSLYTMFTREEAVEVLRLIDEAFATLSNQARRRDYDSKLRLKASRAPATQVRGNDFGSADEMLAALPEVSYAPPRPQARSDVKIEAKPHLTPIRSNFNETRTSSETSLPSGFGRTKFSIYEVDPAFEQEIQSTLRFDGPALQKIRLYKKVTLDHLCEETRISRTYLAAIETDDHAALPAPVFVRGFLVQMSRLLGIDTEKVAKSYLENMKSRSGRS